MPPLEAWEKVLIDEGIVTTGVHAYVSCTECHGGANVDDMEQAHEGMVSDPSEAPHSACAECHEDVQASHENSLHVTLAGYDTVLHERSLPENHPALEEMESNHCNECHATCGQCHVSQPTSVGGGLLEGHEFVLTPPMSRTCTGCHGSRIKDEYSGRNEGIPGDVHLSQGRMNCVDCHSGAEMHGTDMVDVNHRYDGDRVPLCESCHEEALTTDAGIEEHTIHGQDVSCQVCHSVEYKNCSNCHVQQTPDGIPYYEIDPSWMDFKIGLNPDRTPERPWQYVLVRHVPISPTSFEYYGANLLPNFNNRPTWAEATPHNIQRLTPQAGQCENCHGNADIFLTADSVLPEELAANAQVIVNEPPGIELIEQYRAQQDLAAQ